jgi:hypothetical protein
MEILNTIFSLQLNLHHKIVKTLAGLVAVVSLTGMQTAPQDVVRENELKAVFLYNFTQFVEWPSSSFSSSESPFVIGILGKNTLGSYVEEISEGEQVNGHPIVVQYFPSLNAKITECHILFIHKTFPEIVKATEVTKGKPVLTVSDNKDFMKYSGMLRFYVENGKIRFEVNQDISTRSSLLMSSKLMRVATLYRQ